MMTIKKLVVGGIIFVLISATALSQGELVKKGDAERAKQDFVLKDLAGNRLALEDYRGKIVILDFWATWCPPCREEIPDFIAIQKEFGAKGVQVIGISVDRDGPEKVIQFAKQMGINYPIGMATSEVIKSYGGISGIPTTFVIDRKGVVRSKYVGFRPREIFVEEIQKLL